MRIPMQPGLPRNSAQGGCLANAKGRYRMAMSRVDFRARLVSFESNAFQELRKAQEFVLDEYADRLADAPHVAIELPTGVGKTLIALLLADYALDRELTVTYLAGRSEERR